MNLANGTRTGTHPESKQALGLRVLPELRRALKAAAALEDLSMEDYLHQLLCHDLNRMDLLHRSPDTAPGRAASG